MDPSLPFTIWESLDCLNEEATTINKYFGKKYAKMYRDVKSAEFRKFMSTIHPREWDWYL